MSSARSNATRDLGPEGRTGLHVGEVEQRDNDIGGIAANGKTPVTQVGICVR